MNYLLYPNALFDEHHETGNGLKLTQVKIKEGLPLGADYLGDPI